MTKAIQEKVRRCDDVSMQEAIKFYTTEMAKGSHISIWKGTAQIGFGRSKQQILNLVSDDTVMKGSIIPKFKNSRFSNDWRRGFTKRWPHVQLYSSPIITQG
ncbi:hypothetical protein ACJMK2_044355 [Sinanodonta woodiana]|uniref:Uncharacterized protein n=1 Tax=Sinanodonta woodiana TaxID=1069815 RepID=A0ABD3W2Q1_SINWO